MSTALTGTRIDLRDGASAATSSSWGLGSLAEAGAFHQAVDASQLTAAEAGALVRRMVTIRLAEQKLAANKRDRIIGGPVHLGVGQEAIAVGVSSVLRPSDRVFGAHRSHSHVLALGADLRRFFAEVLGRDTGLSRGMGGSQHLWDESTGFYGSVPIVAGTVPLAVGGALASKMQGTGDVAVAYFGDGACEEGVVHESLNLARTLDAPVLFVVENNLFASHMHISLRQPTDSTARFAAANAVPHAVVDGNDVVAVAAAAGELTQRARSGGGPGFIEAVTYRWFGHVDWREDIDVGVNRSQQDVADWRRRDPVRRLFQGMVAAGHCAPADLDELTAELTQAVDDAWEQALSDPYPDPASLMDRVYAQGDS